MSEPNVIRVHLKSQEAMGFFGQAFGTLVLQPTLDEPALGPAGLVVVAYGPAGVGKTEILSNACKGFPAFFKSIQCASKAALLSGVLRFDNNRVFLFKDNGTEVASDVPYAGPIVDMRHGLAIFEHPLLSNLDDASFVMLVGSPAGVTRLAADYFARPPKRSVDDFETFYEPDQIQRESINASTPQIADEMRQMRAVAVDAPGNNGFLRQFLELPGEIGLAPPVIPGRACPAHLEDRYVTLFLTNPSAAIRKNFETFKSKILAPSAP